MHLTYRDLTQIHNTESSGESYKETMKLLFKKSRHYFSSFFRVYLGRQSLTLTLTRCHNANWQILPLRWQSFPL